MFTNKYGLKAQACIAKIAIFGIFGIACMHIYAHICTYVDNLNVMHIIGKDLTCTFQPCSTFLPCMLLLCSKVGVHGTPKVGLACTAPCTLHCAQKWVMLGIIGALFYMNKFTRVHAR